MAYENSIEGKTVSQKSSEQEYVLLADWLQIYVADKNKWNRLWTVLKQQCLMFYVTDSEEDDNWFGTIMLKSIQVEEKILGTEPHCFTLMYQQGEADWSTQNEDITEVLQKGSSLDVMAPSEIAKKCWIDSLSALLPTIPTDNKTEASVESTEQQGQAEDGESTYSSVKPEATETEETAYIEREHAGQVKSDVDIASALWSVLSQVGPGMNLETLSLPLAILEPRSFLDKFADFLLHIDILSQAAVEKDPLMRMKLVTKWYLSGFYVQPKELKKPYTPIIGEVFRCYWYHPETNSKTFYIAEQVNTSPSETAFYIINQKDGFCISGSTVTTVSFSGNSITAAVEEKANVILLPFNERYTLGMPDAQCSGILLGNVTFELIGEVHISCTETSLSTNIDFKTKPFFAGSDGLNQIEGTIKSGTSTIATIKGHWDGSIYLNGGTEDQLFWDPNFVSSLQQLKQFVVPVSVQEPYESERFWLPVTKAILNNDQETADQEMEKLKDFNSYTEPRLFTLDETEGIWKYKHEKLHSWDPKIHKYQFENNFIIQSSTSEDHKPPIIRKMEEYKSDITVPTKAGVAISPGLDLPPEENQIQRLLNSLDSLHENYALLLGGLQIHADAIKTQEGTYVEDEARDKRTLCIFIAVCLIKIAMSLVQN